MHTDSPKQLRRFGKRIRKFAETIGSHLTEHFKIDQIRVYDLWHFQHRLIRKILAHTVFVFFNLMLPMHILEFASFFNSMKINQKRRREFSPPPTLVYETYTHKQSSHHQPNV